MLSVPARALHCLSRFRCVRRLFLALLLIAGLATTGCQSSDAPQEASSPDPTSNESPPNESAADPSATVEPVRVTPAEFRQIEWLEGAWRGTGAEVDGPFFETFEMVNDSTLAIRVYADSALTQRESTGEIVLTGGQVLHRSGPNEWVATAFDRSRLHFEPRGNVPNNFTWTRTSPSSWTAVLRYPQEDGTTRDVVYDLERMETATP